MFIYSITNNIINGISRKSFSRTTRISIEAKESSRAYDRIAEWSRYFQVRSIYRKYSRRSLQSMLPLCSKSKQCTLGSRNFKASKGKKAKERINSFLSPIIFFFIYNPQILFTLIYIDSMFTDELIAFNMIQLNSIFSNIQTFNNTGVV